MTTQEDFTHDAMQYAPQLFSTAMRMTRNRSDAEDLVQEKFLDIIEFSFCWLALLRVVLVDVRVRHNAKQPCAQICTLLICSK